MGLKDEIVVNIVYDVDDVLNNLNDYVFDTLGLQMPSRFNIRECKEFTREQQDKILGMYSNPETFRNLSFVAGADKICDIEKTGKAEVHINSRNLNRQIAEIKLSKLLGHIKDLKEERIELQIGFGDAKKITKCADIVIEDCLGNLQAYDKQTVKILIDKTYNKAEQYGTTDKEDGISRVNSLIEANELVRKLVENW